MPPTVAACLLCAAGLSAAPPAEPAAPRKALDARADVRYVDAPLRTVLRQISETAGIRIAVPEGPVGDAEVRLTAAGIRLSSVLAWSLRGTGLAAVPIGGGLTIKPVGELTDAERLHVGHEAAFAARAAQETWVPKLRAALAKRITIRLKDVSLADAVAAVAGSTPGNYRIDPELTADSGRLDLDADNVPAGEVLALAAAKFGGRVRLLDEIVYLAPVGCAEGFDWSAARPAAPKPVGLKEPKRPAVSDPTIVAEAPAKPAPAAPRVLPSLPPVSVAPPEHSAQLPSPPPTPPAALPILTELPTKPDLRTPLAKPPSALPAPPPPAPMEPAAPPPAPVPPPPPPPEPAAPPAPAPPPPAIRYDVERLAAARITLPSELRSLRKLLELLAGQAGCPVIIESDLGMKLAAVQTRAAFGRVRLADILDWLAVAHGVPARLDAERGLVVGAGF